MSMRSNARQDAFAGCHPLVNFLFFALVIVFSMCLMHPLCLLISFLSAAVYAGHLKRMKSLYLVIPVMVMAAVLNPLLTHAGMTILAWFPDGNPLTLESICYGIAAAVMLGSVILWFACSNEVMSTDKFVYLFGRIIPALSLILSMALRFVPRFRTQAETVRTAQRAADPESAEKGIVPRMKNGVRVFSVMLTWSFENAIAASDSMRSRGYGLPGRTAFSIYHFERRDKVLLAVLTACAACLIIGWAGGAVHFRYYPDIEVKGSAPASGVFLSVYLLLCLLPLLTDMEERILWRNVRKGGPADE